MSTPTTNGGRHRSPSSSPPNRWGRRAVTRRTSALAALGLVITGGTVALADITVDNPETLKAVGPISGEHGYPTWYQDGTNLRLEQCLDVMDLYCDPGFLRGEMPDPDAPISFPDNWPLESFYYLAGAEFGIGEGKAVLTAGLEATMANEGTVDGDQVVFGRLRFDIDFPSAGTFEVTHPYGVDTFEVDAAGDFRYVEDITPAPDNFALALGSRVAPFLVDADGMHDPGNGNTYIGFPGEETAVKGSPHGTNFFRIEQINLDESRTLIGETSLFSLMGKVSTNSGVSPDAAILSETAEGSYLDVFATTDPHDSVVVEGEGLTKTLLDAEGGRYFGRIPLSDTVPAEVTFSNETDRPVATTTIPVTDGVTISAATYDTDTDTLTVSAASTDQVDPPTLTLQGFTDAAGAPATIMADGSTTVTTTAAPATVTVRSTGGGQDSAPVTVTGGAASQPAPTMAVISGPTQVIGGNPVTLENASLNADSVVWTQTSGPDLGISGSTSDSVTFETMAGQDQTYGFTLEATGPGGTSSTTWQVQVLAEEPAPPPPPAPVAVVTVDDTDAYVGQSVTVSGRDSTAAASYDWTQLTGTPVTFTPTDPSFSFQMPVSAEPITFKLVVTSPEGAVAEQTSEPVTQIVDQLTVTSAQYRADRSEWRLSGTASVDVINTVRIYVKNPLTGVNTKIGDAIVAPAVDGTTVGEWVLRVRNGVQPGTSTTLILESTRGGYLDNVPFTRK